MSDNSHDDIIKWKHFPRYWPFVRGIHRPPVNSPHKGQWRWTLIFSLNCAWTNGSVNNRDAGDLSRHRAYHDVTVIPSLVSTLWVTKLHSPQIQRLASHWQYTEWQWRIHLNLGSDDIVQYSDVPSAHDVPSHRDWFEICRMLRWPFWVPPGPDTDRVVKLCLYAYLFPCDIQ